MFLFAEGGHHSPLIVEFINHYLGKPVHHFQMTYTKPVWDKFFSNFGTEAEKVFGEYTVENAIPWYTIMFVIACLLTVFAIWIMKGRLSEDDPRPGQLTLEAGYLTLADMAERYRAARNEVFPGSRNLCLPHSGIEPDGTVPDVHVADRFGQRDVRTRHLVIYLLQLLRHQRERAMGSPEASGGAETAVVHVHRNDAYLRDRADK